MALGSTLILCYVYFGMFLVPCN